MRLQYKQDKIKKQEKLKTTFRHHNNSLKIPLKMILNIEYHTLKYVNYDHFKLH